MKKTTGKAAAVIKELAAAADPERAKNSAWFFKTGPGEYGEGDRFLGVTVPVQRKIAARNRDLGLTEIARLLGSPVHEHRLTGLFILRHRFDRGDAETRAEAARFYLAHRARVNNWDLVDSSASYILGPHLLKDENREKKLLKLARSKSVWDRRIAVMATAHFIRMGEFETTLRLADELLTDKHDLIHKAVGWMIREVGNKSLAAAGRFLKLRYKKMPRTMLRYAIEKYPPEWRKAYLKGEI